MKTFSRLRQHLAEFFLEWEMFHTKIVAKTKTHILSSVTFTDNRAVYEIMWKRMVETGRPQMTIWRRIACWISKTTRAQEYARDRALTPTHTHTHTYVTHYFPTAQWFVNSPQCYVIRALPLTCILAFSFCRQFSFSVAHVLVLH